MQKTTHPPFLRLRSLLLIIFFAFIGTTTRAQISVTASAGTAGPTTYTTLKAAFDAINAGTHQGVINVSVTASTTETATAALNASGTGSATFTKVIVKPATGATPTISGNLSGVPVVKINGANNVKIDGSNTAGGTTRDLTITNTTITTPQTLVIGSVGTTAVTNDTLVNCAIVNGANTSTAIIVSDATSPGTAGYFTNICLQNNSVQKAYIGIYLYAVVAAGNGSVTVTGNSLNASGTNALRLVGVYLQGVNGGVISNNTIGNFESASAEFDRAIWLATSTSNTTISGNTISGLAYTGATAGYAPIGINVSPGITNANISITGNTITDISTTSIGTSTGIYFYSATSGVSITKNLISNIKNSNTGGYGAVGVYLSGSLTASAVDVINNFVWDIAGYGTNLWTVTGNGNGIAADAGGGYNIYYNTVWLNTNETANTGTRSAGVLITSGVTTANSINLRNNLLINTQTVGNANSRLALAVTASTTVFNTFNYNDYYSTSGNLVGQGTNPTIWNTIAQVQTNMGLNANSVSILPVFTSATDLHLPAATNTALNNIGVAIASITDDIDGQVRTATPDMGADEFGNCPVITYATQPVNTGTCDGGTASFSAVATNATLYQWQVNTGSGFTNITNGSGYSGATTATLSISPATAGMTGYTYRLQSFGFAGCTATSSNTVTLTVNALPNVNVSASGSTAFCTGGSVTLTVPTATNQTYQWVQGTTNIPAATANAYVVTVAGSYNVIVTNTVTTCTATSTAIPVTIGNGPAAVISPVGTVAICQGTSTSLSAGSSAGVTYQWSINGSPISGATANTYTATVGGSYTVAVNAGPGCTTNSIPTTVAVNPLPTATSTASGSTAICSGSTLTLNANTGTGITYQWLLNNAIITGATTTSYTASAAGAYRVKVMSTATGCKDTSTPITITINPLPVSTITPAVPATICAGDTSVLTANAGAGFTYQWLLNGNAIAGASFNTYKAYLPGSYTLEVTNSNGCKKISAPVTQLVNPTPPAFITYTSALAFCDGGAVVLNAMLGSAGNTFEWMKDGNIISGLTTPYNVVTQPGSYTIRVTNTFNCVATSLPVPVIVYPIPSPVVSINSGVLSTGSFDGYQWFLNNAAISNGTSQSYTPQANGAYKVKVTSVEGCEGTSGILFFNGLSVNGVAGDKMDLLVYPNPASSLVTVENKSMLKLGVISIINSIGSIVSETPANAGSKTYLHVEGLANGIFYLRIAMESGVVLRKLEVIR